jgi:U6 snRNA-associated Sm-like protein LSm2
MLFYSFFKTLVGQKVSVQLKNNVTITGTLVSVDQFLNLKLDDISVDHEKCPQLVSFQTYDRLL